MKMASTRAAVIAFMNPKMVHDFEKHEICRKDILCLLRHGSQAFHHAPLQTVAVVDF